MIGFCILLLVFCFLSCFSWVFFSFLFFLFPVCKKLKCFLFVSCIFNFSWFHPSFCNFCLFFSSFLGFKFFGCPRVPTRLTTCISILVSLYQDCSFNHSFHIMFVWSGIDYASSVSSSYVQFVIKAASFKNGKPLCQKRIHSYRGEW